MHAFGHVYGLEISGECAHQGGRVGDIDAGQFALHRFGAGSRFTSPDRFDADAFDFVEKGLTLLFGEDFTDQRTDPVHIIT